LSDGLSQDDLDALLAGFSEGASEEASGAEPLPPPDHPEEWSLQEQVAVKLEWGEQKPAAKSEILSQDEIDKMLAELGR
jgi:flagellar motor switch protein FliM